MKKDINKIIKESINRLLNEYNGNIEIPLKIQSEISTLIGDTHRLKTDFETEYRKFGIGKMNVTSQRLKSMINLAENILNFINNGDSNSDNFKKKKFF